jgi:hypothetical protein
MASKLIWKVFVDGEQIASLKHAEDAAVVVGNTSAGVVKWEGTIVWREGKEDFVACDFIDRAAMVMWERCRAKHERNLARLQAAREQYARGLIQTAGTIAY